jgi:hypothetical protein
VVTLDWTKGPILTCDGSDGMNLAGILVDTVQDLGVVGVADFPEPQVDAAASSVMKAITCRYGGCEQPSRGKSPLSILVTPSVSRL